MKKLFLGLIIILFLIVSGYCAEYTEQKVIDQIMILEDGQIQIRQAIKVFKDGIEVAKTYWRTVLAPDQDLSKIVIAPDISKEDTDKVKAVANAVWTDKVKVGYIANKQKVLLPNGGE